MVISCFAAMPKWCRPLYAASLAESECDQEVCAAQFCLDGYRDCTRHAPCSCDFSLFDLEACPVCRASVSSLLAVQVIATNEPQFLQLKKGWSNVFKLASKLKVTVVWTDQALATMLSLSCVPPPHHSAFCSFLQEDNTTALAPVSAGFMCGPDL